MNKEELRQQIENKFQEFLDENEGINNCFTNAFGGWHNDYYKVLDFLYDFREQTYKAGQEEARQQIKQKLKDLKGIDKSVKIEIDKILDES
jgi:hypothetical protein